MKRSTITNDHDETIETLKQARAASGIKKAQVKITAVMLCMDGHSSREIAELLYIRPHTVGRYIKAYNEGGLSGLLHYEKGSGRPSKLTPEEKADCKNKLLATPEAAGIGPCVNWDSRLLQVYIKKTYGKTISRSNLQKIMKSMGFSYTRPTYVLAKADSSK